MKNSNKYVIALVAALGLFPVALDSTIVNVAMVPISNALHASIDTIQWILIGYLLSNAAVLPLSGYLSNRFGVKRLFLLGLGLFTAFSAACGVAPSEQWLVAFRVLQGLGGGLLIPLGMAIALQQFAKEERARATALVGVPLLLAPVVGPIIGGLIIDGWNWQSIFFVNVPVGLLFLALAWRLLPADSAAKEARRGRTSFDYPGLLLPMAGVALLVYAFKLVSQTDPLTRTAANPQGSIYGWSYWLVWVLTAIGLALLLTFAYRALRVSRDPVLDLRLFARRDFTVANLVIWLASIIVFGAMFLVPVFLQQVRLPHLSPLDTGLALLPMGLATLFSVVVGGLLYRVLGARLLVLGGAVLLALACWQFRSLLNPTMSASELWLPLALGGFGSTLMMVPTQTVALEALSGEALTKATSLVNATKLLWASIGSAVLVTEYVQQALAHASSLAAGIPVSALAQPTSPAALAARAQMAAQAATGGMIDVFTLLLWAMPALIVVALFLPGRRVSAVADARKPSEEIVEQRAASA